MASEPDVSAQSAETVPMPVTRKAPATASDDPVDTESTGQGSEAPQTAPIASTPAEPAALEPARAEPVPVEPGPAETVPAEPARAGAAASESAAAEAVTPDPAPTHVRAPQARAGEAPVTEPVPVKSTTSEPKAQLAPSRLTESAAALTMPMPALTMPTATTPEVTTPARTTPVAQTPEATAPEATAPAVTTPARPAVAEPVAAESTPAPPLPPSPRRPVRTRAGSVGVTIVLIAAGLLFTTSAATARGTQLRSERADLADLIEAEDARVQTRAQRVAAAREQLRREAAATSANSKAIRALEESNASVITAAGLYPVRGPGLTITLDDAPRDLPVSDRVGPDDLVVHQQDVQAVVNALWAGGAEAMMLQDQRVISTSAVRCVGNTLILQGRVYSPPYTITAVGDVKKMQASIDSSPQIAYYLQYVASLRLGWSVKRSDEIELPAYAGSLTLSHARVAGSATPSSAAGSSDAASSSP